MNFVILQRTVTKCLSKLVTSSALIHWLLRTSRCMVPTGTWQASSQHLMVLPTGDSGMTLIWTRKLRCAGDNAHLCVWGCRRVHHGFDFYKFGVLSWHVHQPAWSRLKSAPVIWVTWQTSPSVSTATTSGIWRRSHWYKTAAWSCSRATAGLVRVFQQHPPLPHTAACIQVSVPGRY